MRWMPNIPFSSSHHAPRASPSSSDVEIEINAGKKKSAHTNFIRNVTGVVGTSWPFSHAKRLARNRKVRHMSDGNDLPDRKTQSECADDDFCSNLSRSPSGYDQFVGLQSSSTACSTSNASVSPQPLPLPELPRKKDGFHIRPPSPSRSKTAKGVEERERSVDGISDGDTPSILIKSVFTNQDYARRKMDSGETASSTGRGQPELCTSEASSNNFWINIPTRSAPCSPPSLSPRGRMNIDVLPYFTIPNSNHVWSAPEMAASDMMSGLPPPAFFDLGAFSPDSSPVHSPRTIRSPAQCPKCLNSASSPVHSRVSPETTPTRRESNSPAIVHPLPLPPPGSSLFSPGSTMPSPTSSQASPKLDGLSMKSQWQKGKLIGRGTFGSVYVATNRETGALCAMKEVEIFPDDPKSEECIKQLQQEIKVLSHLKHPNIVQYYGSEIVEDRFYIYLEYIHPGSINKYVREHCGAVTEAVVRSFTRHILSGLAYLHSKKTIHRDIKGANLLVDSAGVVKLADFGMAKHLNGQVADLSLRGSPYWMAPELMQAVMQKDKSSDLAYALDIWSLGCTIIEMFTGKPPWSEYEGAAAMFKLMRDTPPIPETLSFEGKDFLNCCFIRNPAERPTAATLLEHRFLKNSHLDTPSSCHPHGAISYMDRPPSSKDLYDTRSDQLVTHSRSPYHEREGGF